MTGKDKEFWNQTTQICLQTTPPCQQFCYAKLRSTHIAVPAILLRKNALNPHRGASNFATQNCAPLPWPRIKPPAGPPLTCFGFMDLCKQACPVHKTKTRRSRLYPRPASWWAIQDSNLRPLPCQGNALTSCANRPSKWVPDSNRCIRLCRPLPSHSANPPMWF